jgi:hypothetical protein
MAPLVHLPTNMNYANMIEEKNLKKTFILATLISTIIGTFTTGINLYERVGEKRRQIKTDKSQDTKIKELEKRLDDEEKKKKNGHQRNEEELRQSLEYGGPQIRREYNTDLARLGPRFAEGDAITQNQLQSQIITLQGTVIHLLEDALYTGRLDNINKLYNASEFAREGSINALQAQYQRMLQSAPLRRPIGPVRRISSTPSMKSGPPRSIKPRSTRTEKAVTEIRVEKDEVAKDTAERDIVSAAAPNGSLVKETAALSVADHSGPLFCRYALDLQETGMPLDVCFTKGGSCACPFCGTKIATEPGRAWKIEKEIVHERIRRKDYDDEIIEQRTFLVNNRFLVKCHREKAGYACLLCYRFRDRDTICESAAGLIKHLWQKHEVDEYESDGDIREASLIEERITQKR